MRKPLSKVQFYGLMASACWALAVTVYVRKNEMPQAQHYAMRQYFMCAEHQSVDTCLKRIEDDWSVWMNRLWPTIAKMTFVPLAVGWSVGFVGMRLFRRRGR